MNKGFTTIELVVTISIFVILLFGISTMLNDIFVNSNQQVLSLDSIDQAKSVMSKFTNEIRDATSGLDGSYPLNQAGSYQVIFYSNYKTSGGVVERVRYYVSGDTLYKGIVLPTGSPSTYNLSSESIKPVLTGVVNGAIPAFYYYDGDYSGSSDPLSQPVNIPQVRYVKINLMVLNQIKPDDSNYFSMAAGATIRSVKDNLGN